MAKSTILLFLAFQVISSLLLLESAIGSKPPKNGLTVKLIHRDSPESPLYRPVLTEKQRTRNLILKSKARSKYLITNEPNARQDFDTNALHSIVENHRDSVFMAEVGIGTFGASTIPYFLHMDTGSSVIWTQCEGCRTTGHHCFHQKQPLFPDSRSRSYRKLPCNNHPLCYPNQCLQNFCTYRVQFHDNSTSRGFLATETFTFGSGMSGKESVPGIVFGCGFDQQNIGYGSSGNIAGLMGLGWGHRSLLAQLGHRAQHRFSYCLVPLGTSNATTGSFLRFGPDIPAPSTALRATELVQVGFLQPYFVNLVDISVANQWLHIPAHYFSRKPHNPASGVVFDSGTTYTSLVQPAYGMLEGAMERHLAATVPGLRKIQVPNFFKLCYQRPGSGATEAFHGLPSVTFHFSGNADLVVQPQGVFYVGGARRDLLCMAVTPSSFDTFRGGATILGAYQQTNQRVIFEVGRNRLRFGPENCAARGEFWLAFFVFVFVLASGM